MKILGKLDIVVGTFAVALGLTMAAAPLAAQTKIISGVVKDSADGTLISGASIRAVGLHVGTYTQTGGRYRLPMPDSVRFIQVRSVGYTERTIPIPSSSGEIVVKLSPHATTSGLVDVVAEIPVEVIIKYAIERKNENAKRIKTIVSTLYTKLRTRFDPGALGDGKQAKDAITETFSTVYDQREPEPLKHVVIQNRRQTKNVSAASNMTVIDQFFDFTQDELKLFQTRLVTPLSEDALSEYKFELMSKKLLGNLMVYEIHFEPKARMYPGLIGKLSIIEGTYQVIAAEFEPTPETAIPFVRQLKYEQRYEKVTDSVWAPMYQQASAKAGVEVIKGVLEVDAMFVAQTYVTDVKVNVPIDDTLLRPTIDSTTVVQTSRRSGRTNISVRQSGQVVTVAPGADSARPEYWEQHSFTEQSDAEKQAYAEADSLKKVNPTDAQGQRNVVGLLTVGDFGFSVIPILDRTSFSGMMFGGALVTNFNEFSLITEGAWGGGSSRMGAVSLLGRIVDTRSTDVDVTVSAFSKYKTIQEARVIFSALRSLNIQHLLYADYFDFLRKDGFSVDVRAKYQMYTLDAHAEWSRQSARPIYAAPRGRESVVPDPGNFQILSATVGIGEPTFVQELFGTAWPVYGSVKALLGNEQETNATFKIFDIQTGIRIPTFATGYSPMLLDLFLRGGIGTSNVPRQYQFSSIRSFPVLGPRTDFNTVPINQFGGTEMLSIIAEHNFSDLWWRALGIPLINNRGVDIIARAGALQMIQRGTAAIQNSVYASTNQWYTEAGFGISRIPTFVSEVIFLRFDARWPVGAYAMQVGSFGWTLGLSSPFN
ncbi:MAG: carboxypeptidase-like regulatory domain-containing protein [Ignavibacteria bacterium]|nr:carboxypeptidase-like regulatory domain-containing protein [Ignavibacteria bacterium]